VFLAASLAVSSTSQLNTRNMNRQMRRMSTSAVLEAAGQAPAQGLAQHRLNSVSRPLAIKPQCPAALLLSRADEN
jgi:hypothetical protein